MKKDEKKEKHPLYRCAMILLVLALLLGVALLIWGAPLEPDPLWMPSVKQI